MRIALGNDHAGYSLKAHVRSVLETLGHEVIDTGAQSDEPVGLPRHHPRHMRFPCFEVKPTARCSSAEPAKAP
jgi:hypothetical protein